MNTTLQALKTCLILFIMPLFLTNCARLLLGNEIVNELERSTREFTQLQSDPNGMLFVTSRFAAKNKRWPSNVKELKKFWDEPKNITDQSAYRNVRLIESQNGGIEISWEDNKGNEMSINLPAMKKIEQDASSNH